MANPSEFNKHPWSSVLQKTEAEVVARNIMVILSRTGDEWRELGWEEYVEERMKDTGFSQMERQYFDKAISYTKSEAAARSFCDAWKTVGQQ